MAVGSDEKDGKKYPAAAGEKPVKKTAGKKAAQVKNASAKTGAKTSKK